MEHPAMTFDEVSMEHSKSFIFALQELKNLRPQLYSAAGYCEKSYLQSDQKQMVLDNIKDYAARALVNAVDHLGTVAYKLSELLEQQTFDVSTMDLKVSTLNQKLLTCHTYTDKEGLRQQQLLAFIPRHHKHYILPNSVNKKVHFSPQRKINARQNPLQTRTRLHSSGLVGKLSLLEFLVLKYPNFKNSFMAFSLGNQVYLKKTDFTHVKESQGLKILCQDLWSFPPFSFMPVDSEERTWMKPSSAHLHLTHGVPTSSAATQTLGVSGRDALKGSKTLTTVGSFDDRNGPEAVQVHTRSKSVLSTFFINQKATKLVKAGYVL